MLLIWGFKTILKVLSEGTFNCPQCGGDRPYKLFLARRWFTFFWIPIFTYKTVGRVVECTGCGTHWEEGVLQRPTSANLSQMIANGMRTLAVEVLRASGGPTTAARQAAAGAVAEAGLHGYTVEAVDQDLGMPPVDPAQALVPLGGSLEPQGREWLLSRTAAIAAADGAIGPNARAFLEHAGGLMQMSPAHVAGIVAMAEQQASGRL